ncbi:MAG: hypothetical protein AAF264_04565 [Pseudomonadota bacterium]
MSENDGPRVATIALADLLPFADADALARLSGRPVDAATMGTLGGSARLRRRWSDVLCEARGMQPSITYEDEPVTRVLLTGDLAAYGKQVDAHLMGDRLRREITGPRVAELRRIYGDRAYEAALTWNGPATEVRADGQAAIDGWIVAQSLALRRYIALRRPDADGDRWTGPLPLFLLEHAAECVHARLRLEALVEAAA